ncbi:unnamed protein product [Rotaria magnacalcarata]|uniref:DFDF domain-containing protein n=2 Tax=Rotaria magnacalcarata TaxID=392030 RepID=A0A8S2IZC1_9BILA|nr:unnamed protein product [Rotaria magnacalcarata]CAF3792281.1 unnamed protein product [Rotaria magnacalcarata]CAF3843611.1 unnamed protein product [Rotaria magnacalcarata]
MSSSFIGSKIAIVTKSQYRYVGTIIGIDSQASSILLGNVKCFGTENRIGNFSNNQVVGSLVPIMQFANSDIEDLKIVEEEKTEESNQSPPLQKQPSIHDDPAIVSAVVSKTKKEGKNSAYFYLSPVFFLLELAPSWSLSSASSSSQQQSGSKSKFFDDFSLNSTEQSQPTRSQQRLPANNYSNQTSRQSYPQQQQRHQNNYSQHQQRYFYNNRRTQMNNNHYRRPGGNGNREAFNDHRHNYEDEFDFETNNRKFNKITNEDDLKEQAECPDQFFNLKQNPNLSSDFEPIYDKKKSFFDNMTVEDTSNVSGPMYNRSRNQDTFGNERNSTGGGYRRSNYNNYRQNNNGYQYRN